MGRRSAAAVLAVVVAAMLAACGGGEDGGEPAAGTPIPEALDLTLDFVPNAVHAGLFVAEDQRLFERAGQPVRVRPPSSTSDGARLLQAGRTDLAILSLHDLAIARRRGADLVAVGALVQQPLGAVVAQASVRRPRDLEGERVGITGAPSDEPVLDQVVRADGGDPARVRRVTIGFEGVQALLARRVAGTIGFWNAEGVSLQAERPGTNVFRLADAGPRAGGVPRYPELVVVATRATLRDRGEAVARAVGALREGYAAVLTDPPAGLRALAREAPSVDGASARRELRALLPAFRGARGRPVGLDRGRLRAWAAWEARVGIVRRAPDVDRLVWDRAPR